MRSIREVNHQVIQDVMWLQGDGGNKDPTLLPRGEGHLQGLLPMMLREKEGPIREEGRKRDHHLLPLLLLLHLLPIVYLRKSPKRRGYRRSYAAWKRSQKLKKLKEGGNNISFLTYDGTFGTTDQLCTSKNQLDNGGLAYVLMERPQRLGSP